jgi:threonine synthase
MGNSEKKGIWLYEDIYSYKIKSENRISIGEGNTPLERLKFLEIALGIPVIYAKREDKNPTGSAKDRSTAFFFSYLKSNKINEVVIPSSGNTAISAAYYGKITGIKLYLFISENFSIIKNKRLNEALKNNKNIEIIKSKRPLSDAIKYAKENHIELFRGSTSQIAIEGYKSLGEELSLIRADALFIPISSGTTIEGISKRLNKNCHIHIVQTSKINTISKLFDTNFKSENVTLADSIVARVTERKKAIEDIINKTKGWGWTVENTEIQECHDLLIKNGINTSYDSSITIAALMKAIKKGYKFKKVILVFTGK